MCARGRLPGMNQLAVGYAATVVGTVVGLLVLLAGEAYGQDLLVPGGGVVVLLSLALLVGLVASE